MAHQETTTCPGCGLVLPSSGVGPEERFNASFECHLLCGDLADDPRIRDDATFLYQTVVDAYAAQHHGPAIRPIRTTFALIGLCLKFERGYTGREVQRAHTAMARRSRDWPRFPDPSTRGAITVRDVANQQPGEARVALLDAWARAVWGAWESEHGRVAHLVAAHLPPDWR